LCRIREGNKGICRVRKNKEQKLYSLIYAAVSSIMVDPIEKKPLFHFLPGTGVLSLGSVGCNMKCRHCQNYEISCADPEEFPLRDIQPKDAVEMAGKENCRSIAWTYNEPIIWHEYTLDSMKLCKNNGIKTVYVTNGYINEKPLLEIIPFLDAANVDVKSFSEDFYNKVTGASLEPVLNTCRVMREKHVHLELTYLVIPTLNDSTEEIKKFCEWVANDLGVDVPVHFTAFFPFHKLTSIAPTSKENLTAACKTARKTGLNYVYAGNLPIPEYENTYCPDCGALLVERHGYFVRIIGLKEGSCTLCGKNIPIEM
jgi:pyruvate formate lyase activating enzyme